ncbi:hypothetical protein Sjap_009607 [Stephania japonica]|uniref:Peptidase S8/S53 domain-containing protein n=1 Tax=Stephania japonica TaxID=461633 RepID=A0AAP0J9K2_9MAGN
MQVQLEKVQTKLKHAQVRFNPSLEGVIVCARRLLSCLINGGSRGHHVTNANYSGYVEGTTVGVAPLARFAMYKVMFLNDTCESASSDTLAGIDLVIEDGVDLMSMSLGFIETPYWENPISLGAFAALEKGIFVSCSAGNTGPHAYTILNGVPWITTVGAGAVDKGFPASVTLGEGVATIEGKSVYPENLLVYGVPPTMAMTTQPRRLVHL